MYRGLSVSLIVVVALHRKWSLQHNSSDVFDEDYPNQHIRNTSCRPFVVPTMLQSCSFSPRDLPGFLCGLTNECLRERGANSRSFPETAQGLADG